MKIINLCSGSSGNCTYLEFGKNRFLVDAGWTAKAILSSLSDIGVSINSISAIFVTHEHVDHISALRVIEKKNRIPIYIASKCAERCSMSDAIPRESLKYFCDGLELVFGDIKVRAFRVPHDSADCFGYRFDYQDESVAIITDIGKVTEETKNILVGCKYLILESNYDNVMLQNSTYPEALKERIFSSNGHLSNSECSELVSYLAENGLKKLMLAHISEENNTPMLAVEEIKKNLKSEIEIIPSRQKETTEFITC